MGRKTIENQIHSALADKIAYGESKHKDKIEQERNSEKAPTRFIPFLHTIPTAKWGKNMQGGLLILRASNMVH